jgi:hypothetical protein
MEGWQAILAQQWKEDAPRLISHDASRHRWVGDHQEDVELTFLRLPNGPSILHRMAENASERARWLALRAEGYEFVRGSVFLRLPDNIPESVHNKVKSEYCASAVARVEAMENCLRVTVSVFRMEQDCP